MRVVPDLRGGGQQARVQLRRLGDGLSGQGERAQPDEAERARDLRPVGRHDLAQRIGVPKLVDRAQNQVFRQQVVELLHPGSKEVVRGGIRRDLPPLRTRARCWAGIVCVYAV
jgi:hypothetical protein